MKEFSFSDMNRASGEILETAMIEPVVLTKRGKEKLVIITADAYRRLMGQTQAEAFGLYDAPQSVQAELMHGINDILDERETPLRRGRGLRPPV